MKSSVPKTLTDEELVMKVITESPDHFKTIVERYQQKFFRYILKYLYDQDKAEDIAQEAFIKIYMNLNAFDTNRNFSSWAYRIAHNEIVNYLRKNKHQVEVDSDTWLPNLADDRPSLSEELDRKISRQRLHQALNMLPIRYREVLILYYFQGCDYQAVAEILAVPVSTVSTRINRAKRRLKKILTKEFDDV